MSAKFPREGGDGENRWAHGVIGCFTMVDLMRLGQHKCFKMQVIQSSIFMKDLERWEVERVVHTHIPMPVKNRPH
jgi:hypothetical protein